MPERRDQTAAERMRRYRERRHKDVVVLGPIEATSEIQGYLITHGYLEPDAFDEPDRIRAAVAAMLADIVDA